MKSLKGLNIGDIIVIGIVIALSITGKLEWYYAVPIIIYLSKIKLD